ncbi:hypothetical protein [Flavobacterium sp. '19STA2R22 D10 B1']|uniref:hypothetical protein n=1 Tax=Flavobacterium aerium TaxID=3037261 RepID=UPI00278BC812|nr:hypothetical protein [Flavobacterium sp. '19STA2R22 D10 B1']
MKTVYLILLSAFTLTATAQKKDKQIFNELKEVKEMKRENEALANARKSNDRKEYQRVVDSITRSKTVADSIRRANTKKKPLSKEARMAQEIFGTTSKKEKAKE